MIYDRFSLVGRTAIVTGGGRGIGRSIALALAEAGADVVVASRTTVQVAQVAEEVRARGREALPLTIDVGELAEIDRMVSATMETFGHIDILVNNAGISPYYTRAEKLTPEMWDEIMVVNLRGLFFCCQRVGRVMIEQKRGVIVNTASAGGVAGTARLSAYTASKGGVVLLTKTLAIEWAPYNIRVNALAPGWVATDFTRSLRDNPDILATVLAPVPLARVADPDEVAGAALFLASDASSYVTGTVVLIDGGATA